MTIDWGDAPAWTAIGLSGCFSLAAFVISLKGLKWQREGTKAAIRSANADEHANAIASLALLVQAGGMSTAEQQHEQEQHVEWTLERSRDRFVLRNTGTAIATGVNVGGAGVAEAGIEVPTDAAVRPGASVAFMMVSTLAHAAPDEIEVTWDGQLAPAVLPVPAR